ncbi:ATP-binding protein [Algiphilus sp. W345]|uniref:histidine kinase n=1 Tax=Banduia mediterranea TaxID=3075609 RepID=A0ABU2WJM6_9GAMM|nr:ATP-binding protein [Algiphilus sp. W345]MDT0498075.1 ATP-binding protein [Algiphilus sp. W345]
MRSIRARLFAGLLLMFVAVAALVGLLTYQRILEETSELFDYQLRQMALSLRDQGSVAPRLQLGAEDSNSDFVIQIWDLFGTRIYLSRPGLPPINQAILGYSDLTLQGERWRVFGLQTLGRVIQVAQPWQVRQHLAGRAALRAMIPLLLFPPLMALAIWWIVTRALAPLRRAADEVQKLDAGTLEAVTTHGMPTEVAPLVLELNRLLARLSQAIEIQRSFVADAAHELRTPLTAVRLQLQLLARAPDDSARQDALARLGEAVDRAGHLVAQLLTLARSEPGGANPSFARLRFDEVVRAGVADAAAHAQSRGSELSLEAADTPVTIEGEAESLRVLVRNLCDNALRYSPAGGTVRLQLESFGKAVRLTVDDSGPGIPAQERERVFDRFHRRSGSTEGGSGLGLAIVKAIAERHAAMLELGDSPLGGLRVMLEFRNAAG